MGETYYKCVDIGECLSTAYRIKEGDFESWHTEWLKTAKRIHNYADDCFFKGHFTSAKEAYLRASNYYRISEFMLIDSEDTRIQLTWRNSKECFAKAINLLPYNIEQIQIPYEGTTLPGHFYHYKGKEAEKNNNNNNNDQNDINFTSSSHLPSLGSNKYPTVVVHGGFDSTLEELCSSAAAPALDRG
jgi:hypothetical protein